jgi:hypothetical protein
VEFLSPAIVGVSARSRVTTRRGRSGDYGASSTFKVKLCVVVPPGSLAVSVIG